MKIHRIFPKTNDLAYINSTGLDKKIRRQLLKGLDISKDVEFNFDEKNKNGELPDFLGVGTSEFFVSGRMAKIMTIHVSVEKLKLIPTEIFGKPYFMLNVIGLRDAIDDINSSFEAFESGNIEEFEKLTFKIEKIEEFDIFRLDRYKVPIFITSQLKEEIERINASGIYFSDPEDVLSIEF